MLLLSLAYRLQEQVHGGLTVATQRKLEQLAQRYQAGKPLFPPQTPKFKPGTRLVRRWQGELHQVTVLDQGFEYQERRYDSLSVIARKITGTRWSGPAFFGLKSAGGES